MVARKKSLEKSQGIFEVEKNTLNDEGLNLLANWYW